ncbi:putative mitochondrial protein AtMg00310 [Apium graveolens]|uniref:putative mitochondrial protein AtMg00310 n=1 Tax=Apium graveolens TaxID=4045 RepID=UPI003D7BDE74
MVLIGNVAQAIPAYTMSCFLLPKFICQDLEIMFNKFWWRSNNDEGKGLNWLSWNKMSKPKPSGGLGFQNLYGFNLALLGKQCWNMIENPHLLVSRIFKARYFSSNSMLDGQEGHNPSFVWKGLLTTLQSLRKRYRWVVENGEDIYATRDQ